MKESLLASAIWAALAAPIAIMTRGGAAQSPPALTGNVGLAGDYRFRGLSQTYTQPAIQVGFDYSHTSGLYLGTWGSNVSGNQYLNGGSLELDLYGGYRWSAAKTGVDVGVVYYWYPKARYNIVPGDRYNTTEICLGARYDWFSARYSHALSDLFGMKTSTIGGYCGLNGDGTGATTDCLGAGSSRGSGYLDVSAAFEITSKINVVLHYGHQSVKSYGKMSYSDYRIGFTKEWVGLVWGVAAVGTDAERRFYRYTPTTAGSTETEDVAKATFVLAVGKTF